MARNRASMREGPLADLFRATEAAQRQTEPAQQELPTEQPLTAAPSVPEPRQTSAPTPRAVEPTPAPTPIRAVTPAPSPLPSSPGRSHAGSIRFLSIPGASSAAATPPRTWP